MFPDLTGRVFGQLTVIKLDDYVPGKGRVWVCHCECGQVINLLGHRLTDRRSPRISCGCGKADGIKRGALKKSADLRGQRFGNLIVVERANFTSNKGCEWVCACDCNQSFVATTSELRKSSGPRSCGCVRGQGRRIDLTGRIFGYLTVLSRALIQDKKGRFWECRCVCGKLTIVATGNLTGNQSCGCHMPAVRLSNGQARLIDIAGMRSGKLVVLARVGKSLRNNPLWLCRCDCGNEKAIRGSDIRSNLIISCGCVVGGPKAIPLLPKSRRDQASARFHARRARQTETGGRFSTLQIENLYRIQKGRCAEPTCKIKLGQDYHRDHYIAVALGGSSDIKNIQLLCPPCNMRKSDKDPFAWAHETEG